MGSRTEFERYFQDHPGVYYRSTGWVERGADLEPLARTQTGMSYTRDALIERYGEDNGRFRYDELIRCQQAYTQLTFIETGIFNTLGQHPRLKQAAQNEAAGAAEELGTGLGAAAGAARRVGAGPWGD